MLGTSTLTLDILMSTTGAQIRTSATPTTSIGGLRQRLLQMARDKRVAWLTGALPSVQTSTKTPRSPRIPSATISDYISVVIGSTQDGMRVHTEMIFDVFCYLVYAR